MYTVKIIYFLNCIHFQQYTKIRFRRFLLSKIRFGRRFEKSKKRPLTQDVLLNTLFISTSGHQRSFFRFFESSNLHKTNLQIPNPIDISTKLTLTSNKKSTNSLRRKIKKLNSCQPVNRLNSRSLNHWRWCSFWGWVMSSNQQLEATSVFNLSTRCLLLLDLSIIATLDLSLHWLVNLSTFHCKESTSQKFIKSDIFTKLHQQHSESNNSNIDTTNGSFVDIDISK